MRGVLKINCLQTVPLRFINCNTNALILDDHVNYVINYELLLNVEGRETAFGQFGQRHGQSGD